MPLTSIPVGHRKLNARREFRRVENQRIMDSGSLALRFPKLKSLKANLTFHPPGGVLQSSEIKYAVNLEHAKSVFRFDCPNRECIGGGFDLSEPLTGAVTERRKELIGEMICQGWRDKTSVNTLRCRNIIRYKFSLGHQAA